MSHDLEAPPAKRKPVATAKPVAGRCLCGAVGFEIDYPAALGLARSFQRKPARAWRRLRHLCRQLAQAFSHHQGDGQDYPLRGQGRENHAKLLRAMRHAAVLRARALAAHGQHPARAVLSRTGRQPLYHIAIEELQEWAYTGQPLVPLKGFPGVVWQRSKKKKRVDSDGLF